MQHPGRPNPPPVIPVAQVARVTRPSVSLLQGMRWVPSHQTDIRATLDKARAELEKR